jgi:hypothetical protein
MVWKGKNWFKGVRRSIESREVASSFASFSLRGIILSAFSQSLLSPRCRGSRPCSPLFVRFQLEIQALLEEVALKVMGGICTTLTPSNSRELEFVTLPDQAGLILGVD